MAPSFPVLEFNSFRICNREYAKNVVSAWGSGPSDVKANADEMSFDQMWHLKPDPNFAQDFYIENVVHKGARLCVSGSSDQSVGLTTGETTDDYWEKQLWSFEPTHSGYFQIVNKYNNGLLTLSDGGAKFGVSGSGKGSAQQWKLDARYACEIEEREIYSYDNSGNNGMAYVNFELTVGVVTMQPEHFYKTAYFAEAIEKAMATKMLEGRITYHTFIELKMEQWRSHTMDDVSDWKDVLKIPLNAYPNRTYRITQFVAVCTGKLDSDKVEVRGPWKAYTEN